jgi:Reverse transcriptase (RNA-dependent DNA polymerase)
MSNYRIKIEMEQVTIRTTRGCPHGCVLSFLLWSLVIKKLLTDLDSQGYEVFGFADNIVIMVKGKVDSVLSERMQTGLRCGLKLCLIFKVRLEWYIGP